MNADAQGFQLGNRQRDVDGVAAEPIPKGPASPYSCPLPWGGVPPGGVALSTSEKKSAVGQCPEAQPCCGASPWRRYQADDCVPLVVR